MKQLLEREKYSGEKTFEKGENGREGGKKCEVEGENYRGTEKMSKDVFGTFLSIINGNNKKEKWRSEKKKEGLRENERKTV